MRIRDVGVLVIRLENRRGSDTTVGSTTRRCRVGGGGEAANNLTLSANFRSSGRLNLDLRMCPKETIESDWSGDHLAEDLEEFIDRHRLH